MRSRCFAFTVLSVSLLLAIASLCRQLLPRTPTVVLVPALFRHTLEDRPWMQEYDTVVYQKLRPDAPHYIPNKAHEAAFYFKYLVDNYERLPDVVLFTQDDTGQDTVDRPKCLRTRSDWGWSPLNQPQAFFKDRALKQYWGDQLMWKCWYRLAADFGVALPEQPVVSTYCCSEFAMTRSRVRQHSHKAYKDAYDTLMLSDECNAGSHLGRGAWAVEHLHHHIFGNMPLQMEALNNTEWCKRFMADCHESNCLPS